MNTFSINYTPIGKDIYARLSGSLRSLSAINLNEQLHTRVKTNQNLIVDVTDVTEVDLTGLNALLSTRIKCTNKQSKMLLKVGLKHPIRDLIALTRFERQFDYLLPTN